MARGGQILARTVRHLNGNVRPGMSTWEIDQIAEAFIRSHTGATPSFKGLYGFPGSICTSINEEIVHGIPSKKRIVKDGDIITLDFGVHFEGYHTDSAVTIPVGRIDEESQRLLSVTQQALEAGIDAARVGNHIGDIGAAIQDVVQSAGFNVARDLVGHGIGTSVHEDPQVPNYGTPKRGIKLMPGLTIAIEPMVMTGRYQTKELADRWTVITADRSRSAHFEHTVAVTADGPIVLTRLKEDSAANEVSADLQPGQKTQPQQA